MPFPFCNSINLDPKIVYERRHWDKDGYERTERRNGAVQCPRCDLWWPCIEEPQAWSQTLDSIMDERMDAIEWWGGVVCEECNLLMAEQPDGRIEVYQLGNKS